jgi:hypothetical protein
MGNVDTNTLSWEGTNPILHKNHLLYQKVFRNRYQNAGVLIDKIFVIFGGYVFQQSAFLCVPSVLFFSQTCSLLLPSRIHSWAYQEKRTSQIL